MRADLRPLRWVALAAIVVGCGGAQESAGARGESGDDEPGFAVELDDEGRLRMIDPDVRARRAPWIAFEPASWPAAGGSRPTLGLALVDDHDDSDLHVLGITQIAGVDALRAVPVDEPADTTDSKMVARVIAVSDQRVTLSVGGDVGVTAGDLFFVMNHPSPTERRPGAHIGALLRVIEGDETGAVARIESARVPVAVGDVAVFAQASFGMPARSATIVVAPFVPGGDPSDGAFPAIAAAVPEYLARFSLSNVGIDAHENYLDPRPYDAATNASDHVSGDYGVVVFGHLEGATLIFNTSTFGESPHPATTVGILPGGLPLEIGESVESLSRQLAPSFIATVLALRGDHALAAWFIESVLFEETLASDVRFHLREHLALRYDSLGRTVEAMRIISDDIEVARQTDDVHALLNALSIRAHLDESLGLYEQMVADTTEFIAVARGVLPEQSIGREKLLQARALLNADRQDDSLELARSVLDDARAREDADLELGALIAIALAVADDPAQARVVLADAVTIDDALDDQTRAYVQLLDAELGAAADDRVGALASLNRALEFTVGARSNPFRASVFRRASSVFMATGDQSEAAEALREAARLYLESDQHDRAAVAMVQLAFLELELSAGRPAGTAIDLVMSARRNIILGAEIALRIGRCSDAARAFGWAAMIERQLQDIELSDLLIGRAEKFARACADYPTLTEVLATRAQFSADDGDPEAAAGHQEMMLVFARAAGIEVDVESLTTPSE